MRQQLSKFFLVLIVFGAIGFVISCKKDNIEGDSQAKANVISTNWQSEVNEEQQQFRKIYIKARELQKKGRNKEAYDLFSVLDPNYKILHDLVLLNRADVAKEIPDEASVLSDLKALLRKYPSSPVADIATYSLGQAYVRLRDNKNASKYFEETINKYPNTDYEIASNYYLGEIYAKSTEKKDMAIEHFKRYIKEAPDGKFSLNSAEAILKLEGKNNLSEDDKQNIGLAFYHNKKYSSAISYLKDNINAYTWYALGKSYQLVGNNNDAINTFSTALNTLTGLDPEEIDNAVKATASIKGNSYESWDYCQAKLPKQADIALYFKSKKLYADQAKGLYRQIVDKFPESRYAPEASWNLFWDTFNSGNYNDAITIGKKHVKNYYGSKSTPRVAFWVGKAYERLGDKKKATIVYEKLTEKFIADYYTFRANGRLRELKFGKKDQMWETNPEGYNYNLDWQFFTPITYKDIDLKYGDKVTELIFIGDFDSAKKIIKGEIDPILESFFTLKDGGTSRSIVIIREAQLNYLNKPLGDHKGWELLYPLHFSDSIKQNATTNNLDPLLVQALTKEESYFNPQAVSFSGARGLMQLMPATAKSVAQWERIPSFTLMNLFDPDINLRLGSRYLKYTHDTFKGNSMLAVAAYNGGPGNVNKWLKTKPTGDWDQFVENIPLDETRNYVRKVFSSYWAYKEIYAGKSIL